jgi:hypothetical protein
MKKIKKMEMKKRIIKRTKIKKMEMQKEMN